MRRCSTDPQQNSVGEYTGVRKVNVSDVWSEGMTGEQRMIDGSWYGVVVTRKLVGGGVVVQALGDSHGLNHIVDDITMLRKRPNFFKRTFSVYTPLKLLQACYWGFTSMFPFMCMLVALYVVCDRFVIWVPRSCLTAVKDPMYDQELNPAPPCPPFIPLVLHRNRIEKYEMYMPRPASE